jgi:putative acetyltransferase
LEIKLLGWRSQASGFLLTAELLMTPSDCAYFVGMNSCNGTLEIRTAVQSDATEIVHVRREAILSKAASHYDQAIVEDWADAMDAADRIARIERNISDPGFVVLVAEAGGDLIGFASAALANHELQTLYVRPNQIGNVGRALLAALEKIAFETVPFLVCDASLNAEAFYKANGYIEECRKDYVSRPGGLASRVVRMRKHRPNAHPG